MLKVEFDNVSHTFDNGVTALSQVDLVLEPGASVALVGANGAGKSTLARHINGLLKPGTGAIRINGADISRADPADLASQVGLVFQNPDHQIFKPTVWSETAFGPRNLGRRAEEVDASVRQALDLCGLTGHEDTHPYDLSPADRKKLALASVLAMDTAMVILDEPTMGLDARGLARLAGVLDMLRSGGKTMLVITHDMDFCAENLDEVIVMAGGEIIDQGPVRSVFSRPDRLPAAGVVPPQTVRLARHVGLESLPLTPEEFVDLFFHAQNLGEPK